MIKEIRVLCRDMAEQFANDISGGYLASHFDCEKTAVIGLLDPDTRNAFEIKADEVFSIAFDDIIAPIDGLKPIDSLQAAAIREFIQDLHASPEPTLLVVQCANGKSRSGAVAKYACQHAEIPEERFTLLNPNLTPNFLVFETLQGRV